MVGSVEHTGTRVSLFAGQVLTCLDGKGDTFAPGIGGESVVDAARDRRLFRDDSDTLPVEVLEEGHKRRYEGGLVAGNRTHERWVRLFVRCEVAEPASRVSREGGGSE